MIHTHTHDKMVELAARLRDEHRFLFVADIYLEHAHLMTIGFLVSSTILMIIIMFGVLEVHQPLRRLKLFKH